MRSVEISEFVRTIHESPNKGGFVVAGGGIGLIADLLVVPGASNTVLDVAVPYSEGALKEYLGVEEIQACCAQTASDMAAEAAARAKAVRRQFRLCRNGVPRYHYSEKGCPSRLYRVSRG